MTIDPLISREEALGGMSGRVTKQASLLLILIENRTIYLLTQSQQAAAFALSEAAASPHQNFLDAIAQGRDLPFQPTIRHMERYAAQWAILVPANHDIQAAVAHLLGQKYKFTAQAVPGIRAALSLDSDTVLQAYQRLYNQPLASIYISRVMSLLDQLRWRWARLAGRLENLPPFWLACILTVVIGAVSLALPIAVAGIGPLPGVIMIIVIGLINMITIAAMAETVTRSSEIRFGSGFIGRIVDDYLGQTSSLLLSIVLAAFSFGLLLVFYLGISTTLEGASGLPAEMWMVFVFLIGLYFLTRGSLNATLALTIVIGLVNMTLLLILSLLAFAYLRPENLLYINVPWLNGQPFDPTTLSFLIGVVMGIYSAHVLVVIFGKLLLQRDPSGREVIKGHTVGIGVAIMLNVIWVLAASGAVAPHILAKQQGTSLVPLTATIGPIMGVLGAIFVIVSMGLGMVQFSVALFNLAHERVDTPKTAVLGRQGRFLLSLSPIILVFLLAEWMSWTNTGSFTGILAILGIIVDSLMTGIFPVLLLVASRRKGELVPQVVHSFLGNPLLLTGIYLLCLLNLLFHALIIWQNPLQRLLGLAIALLMLGLTIAMIRRGVFSPRMVIELRDDRSRGGKSRVYITANGQSMPVEVQLGYDGGEELLQANSGTIRTMTNLRYIQLNLPPTTARELKVLAHTITPDGTAQNWPGHLTIKGSDTRPTFDAPLANGQVTLPITDETRRIVLNFSETIPG
ncbi:MAG: hypothetical protein KDJ52_05200 [Anaerolineae bacterium]|nr:hypothetical protein [Anaerolineae bacterium]